MPDDLGYKTNIRIGASVATLADCKIEPVVRFIPASEVTFTVVNKRENNGDMQAVFEYPDRMLTGEQYYQLRSLVSGGSAAVAIQLLTNNVSLVSYEPVIATYNATMHWPTDGVTLVSNNRWEVEEIMFTNMTLISVG